MKGANAAADGELWDCELGEEPEEGVKTLMIGVWKM